MPVAQRQGTGSEGAETQDGEEGGKLAQLQAYGTLVLMLFMILSFLASHAHSMALFLIIYE